VSENHVSDAVRSRIDKYLQKSYRSTFCERIELLLHSEPLFRGEPYAIRYGKTLEYILRGISAPVSADEPLLGQIAERIPTDTQWRETESVYRSWWEGKSDEELQRDVLWFYSDAWLRCRPPWFYSFGHLALDWNILTREGLSGFQKRTQESREAHNDAESLQFLEGVSLSHQAISAYIARYADAAEKAGRKADAACLRHISSGAPRSFREALQLIWLVTLAVQKVCGCGVLNYSRMDRYLLDLYRGDIQSGGSAGTAAGLLHQKQ
jgi:hypothetical protein